MSAYIEEIMEVPMGAEKKLFSDLARMAGSAAGLAAGMREEVENLVRHRVQNVLSGMDLVRREEFEAVKQVAQTARAEQEKLEVRLATLEAAYATRTKESRPKKSTTGPKS